MTAFGRYQAGEPLGRGGMGAVFRGHDPLLERDVAIKVLEPAREVAPAQLAEWRERFFREARAVASLQHPHIVQVFDLGIGEDGRPWLVMELIEGASLDVAVRAREPFAPAEAARIGEALGRALQCAHERAIIHRDVKPANVLRGRDGTIKLMDFGIARVSDSTLTAEGTFLGSPQYSAPEQVRGAAPDGRADLYSLGLLLYLLLTHQHPFARASFQDTLRAIVQDPAPLPSTLRPELGPGWDALLGRAMAKDPARRFGSAAELAEALAALRTAGALAGATAGGFGAELPEPIELVVTAGPAEGARFALDAGIAVAVGREGGGWVIADPTISARHARIEAGAGRWILRDLGSTNGTWLGGSRVEVVELGPGVDFALGSSTRVRAEACCAGRAAPAAAPASTVLDAVADSRSRTAAVRPLAGSPRFVLVIESGPRQGDEFALTRALVLGRDEGDVRLGDQRASRKHATVELKGTSRVVLRDLASSNGTWLGEERVREVELKPGDEFRIGGTRLRLVQSSGT